MSSTAYERDLIWIGQSKKDLEKLPPVVQEEMGFALLTAQMGDMHEDAVPMKGFHAASVIEFRVRHASNTYRLIYTVAIPGTVCVLHAFQKKSTRGIATPQRDLDLIKQRLRDAQRWRNSGRI